MDELIRQPAPLLPGESFVLQELDVKSLPDEGKLVIGQIRKVVRKAWNAHHTFAASRKDLANYWNSVNTLRGQLARKDANDAVGHYIDRVFGRLFMPRRPGEDIDALLKGTLYYVP